MSIFADFPAHAPVLQGALVRLEPLGHRHAADLAIAAEEGRDSYGFTGVPRGPEIGKYLAVSFEPGCGEPSAPCGQGQVSRAPPGHHGGSSPAPWRCSAGRGGPSGWRPPLPAARASRG